MLCGEAVDEAVDLAHAVVLAPVEARLLGAVACILHFSMNKSNSRNVFF